MVDMEVIVRRVEDYERVGPREMWISSGVTAGRWAGRGAWLLVWLSRPCTHSGRAVTKRCSAAMLAVPSGSI
jgi:hypothetical protein